MPLPFHTIWLGGSPPLRVLDNLGHLLQLRDADPGACQPLLWLDRSAWQALQQHSALPLQPCPADPSPAALAAATITAVPSTGQPPRWLRLGHPSGVWHAPVLLLEEQWQALIAAWQPIEPARASLAALAQTAAGRAFLQQELDLADPASATLLQAPRLLAYLQALIEHTCQHWAAHGLLCLASDLLRLLALCWRPGAYGDLGDVAGRLLLLPGSAEIGASRFCAHHTVAIENDLILAGDRVTLQAITLATALWSWRSVRAVAERLQIRRPEAEPAVLLQAVLPELDRRLPQPPSLLPLLQPPWTRLADFINLAYGAAPVFHPPDGLAPYGAGRRGKELLINDIGGFTGYQKAAHHLAPGNARVWAAFAARLGLDDYAPQLGWTTYGFGSLERLIDAGRRLHDPASSATMAAASHADLAILADTLRCSPSRLAAIAGLAHQLHQRLSDAHHQPERRRQLLAEVEALCADFRADA